MEKSKLEQISDEMFELGQEFSQLAKEAVGVKNKKIAFDMALRAYGMVVKSEPRLVTDVTVTFLEQISSEMLRSDVWNLYLDWNYQQGTEPVPKAVFFSRMEAAGFKSRRKTHGWVVKPPLKSLM